MEDDQFEKQIPVTPNVALQKYCPNCGLIHSESHCPKPSLNEIISAIGHPINSRKDPMAVFSTFSDIWNPK